MKLKRKSYIIDENNNIVYDRSGPISERYLHRYNYYTLCAGYKIIKTYKCPGCIQNNCRLSDAKTPFIIIDKDLTFQSCCTKFFHGHSLALMGSYMRFITIQDATKLMYDNLPKLKTISLETTLLITNMYNFFLSQGEYKLDGYTTKASKK